MIVLYDDNFLIYAIKHYHNPSSMGIDELEDDLKRFKYVKRLLNRYKDENESVERLILNHLVVLYYHYHCFYFFYYNNIYYK